MEDTIKKVIISASKTLTLLSKARCVEKYYSSCEDINKNLYAWPSKFESDEEVKSFIRSKGILFEDFRVKSYVVDYKSYKDLKTLNLPEVTDIRLARTLLQIFQIITEGENIIKITAIWDSSKYPKRLIPTSMSDFEGLRKFSEYRDSMLIIERENTQYDIKLPAFAYRAAIEGVVGLEEYPLHHNDRSSFIGNNTDEQGRSKRYIVHKGNKDHFTKMMRQTINSINKLIGDDDWVETLRRDARFFYN